MTTIKTWQERTRKEKHLCAQDMVPAMQQEIDELRAALAAPQDDPRQFPPLPEPVCGNVVVGTDRRGSDVVDDCYTEAQMHEYALRFYDASPRPIPTAAPQATPMSEPEFIAIPRDGTEPLMGEPISQYGSPELQEMILAEALRKRITDDELGAHHEYCKAVTGDSE